MKRVIIIFYALILLLGSGCKKYLDVNHNPNASTNAGSQYVLPSALTTTANIQITGNSDRNSMNSYLNSWLGYWAPNGSFALSAQDAASYYQDPRFTDQIYQFYFRNLEDYQYVESSGKTNNAPFYEAAAKTMKAYVFQQMVDLFNNIPYSQALNGTSIIQPKYDDAKSIYESLSLKLDTVVTLMNRTDATALPNSDVMFNGNTANWIAFANTLKLRLLIRQTEMSGRSAYIQTEINKILANHGGFLTTDAIVNPGFSAANPSSWWAFNYSQNGTVANDYWRASQYAVSFLKNNNDVRDSLLYAPANSNGQYVGNILGLVNNHPGNDVSNFGPGTLKSANQGAVVMTAAESYFLQAEAALRGFTADDPAALYKQGVQASFNYLFSGVSGFGDPVAKATAYYSQPGNKNTTFEACTTFSEKLALIIRQKWVSEDNTTPIEAWDDYRRLHLPADLPLSVSPYLAGPNIPVRFLYPNSEYIANSANVLAQGTINAFSSKIFWMP